MLNILVTADLHLDRNRRIKDLLNVMRQMYSYAIKNKVDYLLFLGDAYQRRRPYSYERKIFQKWIKAFIDKGIKVILLSGNHDLDGEDTAINEFETLNLKGVKVINKERILKFEGVPIFIGHLLIDGAELGPLGYSTKNSITKQYLLKHFPAKLYLFGHVHKEQELCQNPPMIYVGSPERMSFGERNENKRFLYIHVDKRNFSYKSINLKTRPMIQININAEDGIPDIQDTTNAIVKFVIRGTKVDLKKIKDTELYKITKNAYDVKIMRDVIRERKVRNKRINETLTPLKAFTEYCGSKKVSEKVIKLGEKIILEVMKERK